MNDSTRTTAPRSSTLYYAACHNSSRAWRKLAFQLMVTTPTDAPDEIKAYHTELHDYAVNQSRRATHRARVFLHGPRTALRAVTQED